MMISFTSLSRQVYSYWSREEVDCSVFGFHNLDVCGPSQIDTFRGCVNRIIHYCMTYLALKLKMRPSCSAQKKRYW